MDQGQFCYVIETQRYTWIILAGILQRVTRDSSDDLFESSGNGDDDGRALEFRSEGKISEIVLTQVNTNEGEGNSKYSL